MKYILFEKSAVETIINDTALQSLEFPLSKMFIESIREEKDNFDMVGIAYKKEKDGIIFCGKSVSKTFLFIDLEKCKVLEKTTDAELLVVLQKTFRFAVRFWNRQSFTNCEKIFKDKTVIFPFPFSIGSTYRIVLERNPFEKRLDARGINNSLLAYKYGKEGAASGVEENPDLGNFRKGGETYISCMQELSLKVNRGYDNINDANEKTDVVHIFRSQNIASHAEFKFMNFEMQINSLTDSQKKIVNCEDITSPIRVEGPAGTGKTAALVLRAIKMLRDAEKSGEKLFIYFFTHSKSTENAVRQLALSLVEEAWLQTNNNQRLEIMTLQDYCIRFINIQDTQIIDLDASEAKQYQLLLIQDAFSKINGSIFNTYKYLMSKDSVSFFENEEENKIIMMLQYEFSIRIKGMAESDLERYKKLQPLANGLPLNNDMDKEFVFRIFTEYQESLETQSVYDTDDIILEALARLNAPLWRRARVKDGVDYIMVDEMHLFNLNEQQVFHFLTKDVEQKKIPICFALDYGQVIGDRGSINNNYIEQNLSVGEALCQEFATVFRSSQQIAELCASITATGALMFDAFVNPYKYCESSFTAREEDLCEVPKLIMYENDEEMKNSLECHIKTLINKFKCSANEIALVFFDEAMLVNNYTKKVGKYSVNYINGRQEGNFNEKKSKIVCTLPEYINGLEFKCVILIGVDEGRVPQSGIYDVSLNFLKYSALNKLYISCSRAQYDVLILGTKLRGESSCLNHSLSNGTLKRVPE